MTFDELKARLDRLDVRLDTIDASVRDLQRFGLRVIGAASLLGGVVIFILSRALGL